MAGLAHGLQWTALLAGFMVSGIGVGLLNPVIADVALSVVPKEQAGWRPGSTTPSARSGSRSGSPPGERSSSASERRRRRRSPAARSAAGRRAGWSRRPPRGRCRQAVWPGCPQASQEIVRNAAEQGFLHGLNEILAARAPLLSFAGAVLALWLVRERDIEREPVAEASSEAAIEAHPQAAQA